MQLVVDDRTVHAATGAVPLEGRDEPLVVLLHGSGMDRSVWSHQTRFLAHHGFRAVAVDLPGHGRSEGPALDSIEAIADWVARLAGALDGPAHLVGHSMGALVALDTAARHPGAVASARELAAGWGGNLHDVCVAGGAVAARVGELVLFVGGRDDLPPAAAALLDNYGNHVIAAGPVGAGAAMKLAFNVMTYAQFAASAAAIGIAEGAEVDTDALVGAWRRVGQLGVLTERFLPILDLPAEYLVGASRDRMQATTDIARKDLRLAAEMCADGDLRGMVEALERAMPEVFGVGDEKGGAP